MILNNTMFEPTPTLPHFTFGQFSETRKLIINGGAISGREVFSFSCIQLLGDDIDQLSRDGFD